MKVLKLFCILLLAGCSVHQPTAEKFGHTPESYNTQVADVERQASGRWWLSFNDLALNSLMERCFTENLDLEMALARLEQVEALEKSQHTSLWPEFFAAGSAGQTRTGTVVGAQTNDIYSLSIGASYELDLWHKLQSRRQAASLTSAAAVGDLHSLYLSLSAQLAEGYYQVVELRDLITLNEDIIASFQDTVDLVTLRYQRGLVSALDLYQAKQNLLAAKAEYPLLHAQLSNSIHRMALLLGTMPGQTDFASLAVIPELNHSFSTGLPSELLMNRPDVGAAFLKLQAADQEVGAAIAERFPSFKLTANYGGQDSELSDILDSPNIFWNLLVNISQPIIDGGRRKSEVKRRQAIFRELAASYHKTVLTAFAEVEDALANEKGIDASLTILTEREYVTEASWRLALERYQQGLTDFIPVLTAQSSHANAKIALIKAQRQRISSRIQLARALGGSWMVDDFNKTLPVE